MQKLIINKINKKIKKIKVIYINQWKMIKNEEDNPLAPIGGELEANFVIK